MEFIDLSQDYVNYKDSIDKHLQEVFSTAHFIQGPKVEALERSLSEFVGVEHCITCSDGTTAIEIALLALGIGKGDEVITVPYTWISSAETISIVGAKPVFVDVKRETFNMDPGLLEAAITPNTKAIIAVSLFGQIAPLEAILKIAAKHNIPVIEDAAQSFGASFNGQRSCSIAEISTTSFFPTKPLGCFGDGGCIFTKSADLAKKMRAIAQHGATVRGHHWCIGRNSRLDAVQAGILLAKIGDFENCINRRKNVGKIYDGLLKNIPGLVIPHLEPGNQSVYAQYTIQVNSTRRDEIRTKLKDLGIPTMSYYTKCLHEQPVYESLGYAVGTFPNSEFVAAAGISLPMHQWLTLEQQEKVAKALAVVMKVENVLPVATAQPIPFVGVVGAGYWGKNHVKTFFELGVLHTICETDEKIRESMRKLYPSVQISANFSEVISNPQIKAVVIVVPAPFHYDLTKQALEANRHVLVEKPLTLSVEQSKELRDLARQRNLILVSGHLMLFHPAFVKMKELIRDGAIGQVSHVHVKRMGLGIFREEDVIWSLGVHDISMLLNLFGIPSTVSAVGNNITLTRPHVHDYACALLSWREGDVIAKVETSWISNQKEQCFTVVGTRATIVFDDCKDWHEKLVLYGPFSDAASVVPRAVPSTSLGRRNISVDRTLPLTGLCDAFSKAVSAGTRILINDASESIDVAAVVLAALKSISTNGSNQKVASNSLSFFAHPSALVDDETVVGAGTKIWHFSHVMSNCKIGTNCSLGQNVVVHPGSSLGNNCKVQNNVSIYGGVSCGDHVFLGPSMVFTNVKTPRSQFEAHGKWVITRLNDGVSVGANATIVCGTTLGNNCFVGAGAVVCKNVKPFAVVVGNPAKQIGWMGLKGEKILLPLKSEEPVEFTSPESGLKYRLVLDEVSLITE